MRLLIKHYVSLTAYLNCKYFSTYTLELLGCLLGISPSFFKDYNYYHFFPGDMRWCVHCTWKSEVKGR